MNTPVLILHRKSANRPEVKEAVKSVRQSGIDLKVRIPWNKKDKQILIKGLLKQGYRRVIAGGGEALVVIIRRKRDREKVATEDQFLRGIDEALST